MFLVGIDGAGRLELGRGLGFGLGCHVFELGGFLRRPCLGPGFPFARQLHFGEQILVGADADIDRIHGCDIGALPMGAVTDRIDGRLGGPDNP